MRKVEYVVMIMVASMLLIFQVFYCASFAEGLSQYELAELLVNKAIAENLIQDKEYTEDEVLTFVETYDLMDITDSSAEMDLSEIRKILAGYDTKKSSIGSTDGELIKLSDLSETKQVEVLEDEERLLSHEFMQMTAEERRFTRELGSFALDGESFPTTDDDEYPLMNKYRYELYRIFGWYARKYNLYVHQTPASVSLYRRESDVSVQNTPLIEFGFSDNPTDDNGDGIAYHVRIRVNALYKVDFIEGETLAEGRKRVIATGFKQPHLVMALKDASSLFIKDKVELNEFVDSYVADVVENEDKEYSYVKRRHEMFGDTRYYIAKVQPYVVYFIDNDLSTWED